jgi:hypothetical protein
MAFYQILRWQDIPTQVKVWDDIDEVRLELPPRFMARVDQLAQTQGLTGTDDYLSQWNWSGIQERHGTVSDVADAVCKELEGKFPK